MGALEVSLELVRQANKLLKQIKGILTDMQYVTADTFDFENGNMSGLENFKT